MTPIIASNLEGGFILDKQYLLKYLFPIFNGFVWQEYGKFPIMLSSKDLEYLNINNNHEITLLIDISGSIKYTFSDYKSNIQIYKISRNFVTIYALSMIILATR
ncbi:hypothetical protein [Rickettsia asembonensis]|uniref:hypothetical protein n=1 Tax=Rickettsia asembonensis TaxID=1068590 RepID=UPI0023F76CAE|nr:hypothetical protein [Rickettsia asembonensis]